MKVRLKMNITVLDKLTEGLNEQQKQAVEMPINSFTKVVAGAGTGKTKIISKRYIKLVNDLISGGKVEKPLEHLLVITFTQKAATEMKERILKELKENEINSFGQENRISTIHAFCSEMLKRHAIEANLSPNFKLADDNQLSEIYETIIRKIRYGECDTIDFIDEILSDLKINKDILEHKNILKLKAVGDLEDVFNSVLPIIKQVKSLGLTPKEFLDKTLSSIPCYSSFIGNFLKNKYTCSHFSDIYSDEMIMAEDWCNYFKNNDFADDNYKNSSDDEVFEDLMKILVDKNNTRKSPKTVGWTPKSDFSEDFGKSYILQISELENLFTKVIAVIYAVYQKQLEELDLIDFDDLINKTLFILKNNEVIRSYYKKYFKHIIVDEFQDTSGAQLDLLMNLIADEEPNITVVGDRKQSIYAFRYAKMENLDILEKKIEQKFASKSNFSDKFKIIKLETNYRSTSQVLDAVNAVTEHSLKLDEPLNAFSKEEISRSVKFSKPEKCSSSDEYRALETKYIASEILEVMHRDSLKYKDFAVLVKSHEQADFIEEHLAKYGIPSVKKVNTSYFSKPIVKNISCLFNFVRNVRNEIALVKILEINFSDKEIYDFKQAITKNVANIDEDGIADLNLSEKILLSLEKNSFDNINCPEEIKTAVKSLYDGVLDIIKNKNNLSLSTVFYKLLDIYQPYKNLSGTAKSLAEIDVTVFEKILADYVKNAGYSSVKNFIEYLQIISEDKNFEMPNVFAGEIDAVRLMTIHASKGLEFPYTFVAGISSKGANLNLGLASIELNEEFGNFGLMINKFHGKDSLKYLIYKQIYKAPREYAEAKRRFYVAVSRAEKYLNVLICNSPQKYLKDLTEHNAKKGEISAPLEHLVYPVENENLSVENKSVSILLPDNKIEVKTIAPKFEDEKVGKYYLSFSKINTFNHCQKAFVLKYVYGYPDLGKVNSGASAGSILHSLIYHSFVNKKILSISQIQEYLKDVVLEKVDYDKVLALYSSFAKSEYSKLFSAEILAEYGFEYEYKNIIFKGDIDLIVKNSDNSVDIIDFKSNENLEISDYGKQMAIYKTALEKQGFVIKNLVLANVKSDCVKDFVLNQSDLDLAKKEIDADLKNIKKITEGKFADISGCQNCKYCGYDYICSSFDNE